MKYFIIAALILIMAVPAMAENDSLKVYLTKGGKGITDKDYDKAKVNFEHALRLDPNNFEATKSLGVISSTTGRAKLALEYFTAANKLKGDDPEVLSNLGVLASDNGNFAKAAEYFKQAVSIKPNKSIFLTNLAQALTRLGNHSEAIAHLKKADSIQPNSNIWYTMANSYAATKNYVQAEIYFEKCIRDTIATAELFYFTGIVKQNLNKFDEAISFFDKSLQIDSTYIQSRQSLGISYFLDKQYKSAITQFTLLNKQFPNNHNYKISLGVAYALAGERVKTEAIVSDLMAVDSTLGFQMLGIIKSEMERLGKSNK